MYEMIEAYVERLLTGSTPEAPLWNIEKLRDGKKPSWHYVDGCMLTAFRELGDQSGDPRFGEFVRRFIDYYVAEDGQILGYDPEDFNLDDVNEGRVLFRLYAETGGEKYRRAIERIRGQLERQPRTFEGSFWHKKIYSDQVWLDGLYMAQPFQLLWERDFGTGDYSDVKRQILTVRRRMYVPGKGLYRHGYDASRKAFWANPRTGRSKNFWLRSLGWFAVALADILELWPDEELLGIFRELMAKLLHFRDRESGMYWQVPDKGGRAGNYLETSGSSMIAYAMLKGARLGYLDKKYAAEGKKTFDGICKNYLRETEEGLCLGGICLMAGLGPEDKPWRDGSFAYYLSEPIVENDAKGVAPFVLCYSEVRRLG